MVCSMFQSMKRMVAGVAVSGSGPGPADDAIACQGVPTEPPPALLRHSCPPHPRRLCVVRTQCSVSPIKEKRLAPAPPSRNLHIIFPGRGNMSGDMHYNSMAVCEYAQRYGRCIRCGPRRATSLPGAFLGNPRYFPGRRAIPPCWRQAKRASGDSPACPHPQGGIT